MAFSILDLFLAMGIGQGAFLLIAISLVKNADRRSNQWLMGIILASSIMLAGRIIGFGPATAWSMRLGAFVDITIFLLGPLSFNYVLNALRVQNNCRLPWFHWLPSIGHLLFFIWSVSMPFYQWFEMWQTGRLNLPFFIMESLGLLSMISYTLTGLVVIRSQDRDHPITELSQTSGRLKFVKLLLYSLVILEGFWLFAYLETNFLGLGISALSYGNVWALIPLFLFAVAGFGLTTPAVLRRQSAKKTVDRLPDAKSQKIAEVLNDLMEREQVYLIQDLTLASLASMAGVSSNDLSWLLNAFYKKSFYDFVNAWRVKAFEAKVRNQEHKNRTLLALAYEAGFNSKTTFNKAFKAVHQETPSNFVKRYMATQMDLIPQ